MLDTCALEFTFGGYHPNSVRQKPPPHQGSMILSPRNGSKPRFVWVMSAGLYSLKTNRTGRHSPRPIRPPGCFRRSWGLPCGAAMWAVEPRLAPKPKGWPKGRRQSFGCGFFQKRLGAGNCSLLWPFCSFRHHPAINIEPIYGVHVPRSVEVSSTTPSLNRG